MITLDSEKIKKALKEHGYGSILELAQSLRIHRNTIHYHLSGRPVLPESLEKLMQALDLKPADIMVEKKERKPLLPEKIAALVDQLCTKFPNVTIILFGSRTGKRAHKYSDFDFGVFASEGIPHPLFIRIAKYTEELADSTPYMIDIVNLNNAGEVFLKEISRSWIFLAGSQQDWIALQKRALA